MDDHLRLARVIRRNAKEGLDRGELSAYDAVEYAARIVERFEPARPCHYAHECVMHGRCPFDPVCNN